jgi:hypothetical protein
MPLPCLIVHFCLDAKTNQKNQGCAGIGYLRSICAKIFQTRSQARSNREDFFTLRLRSGRDADPSEAGHLAEQAGRRVWRSKAACCGQLQKITNIRRWHTSKQVQRWLDEHERMEVMLLSKRSLRTNPTEDLWRVLENLIVACLARGLDIPNPRCGLTRWPRSGPQTVDRLCRHRARSSVSSVCGPQQHRRAHSQLGLG